jgi:AcrR family transcriptional regulator
MAKRRLDKNRKTASLRTEIEKDKRTGYRKGILQAAGRVFSRLGFGEAKMVDIAAEAGVSVGTLYNYFKSKDEVIHSLSAYETEELRSRIALVEGIEDPLERIQKTVLVTCQFVEERGALMSMGIQAGLIRAHGASQLFDSAHRQMHLEMLKVYQDALSQAAASGTIRSDVPINHMALMFIGMVTAMIFEWIHSDRKLSLSEQSGLVFDLFMKGALAR